MRAVLCKSYGPPEQLVTEQVDDPVAGRGQAVVDVHACGVNFPDLLIIQNLYQLKPPLPFSPGSEIAGVVAEVGDGVEEVSPGDRVIALTGFGGFAERVVCAADRLIPIPEQMDFTTAACFLLAYATAYHALRDRAELQPGEKVLVLGAAGGVGLAAVQIAKAMGARVIAAASSADKLAFCRENGADHGIDYAEEDLKRRARQLGGGGVDVVVDVVGGPYTEPALRALDWDGRLLVIGFAAGEIPAPRLNLTLLKGTRIVGVNWPVFAMANPKHNAANLEQLFAWQREGKLELQIGATYPLSEAGHALREMAERRVRGKLALVVER